MSDAQDDAGGDHVSSIQMQVIRLLASGCTAKYAALVLKLDFAQVRKWMKHDKRFQTALANVIEQSPSKKDQATPQTGREEPRAGTKESVDKPV